MAKKRPFVLLALSFALILLFLTLWVIRRNSGQSSDSFLIHDVVISTEVDDTRRLTGVVSRFPYGSRQIFMRFNYTKTSEEADVRILWFMEDRLIQSESYSLLNSSGAKVFCLAQENGRFLPKGAYSVGISDGMERISDFRFEIY